MGAPIAAACAATLGLALLGLWYSESIGAGLNDTGNYRPRPNLALGWAAEILLVSGIGALLALRLRRRSRLLMWGALAVVAAVAVAVPWQTTDWSLRRDQQPFEQIQPPANWDVSAYEAVTWTTPRGKVGRTFLRSFLALQPESVTPDALLAHYRSELPAHTCAIAPTGGGLDCSNGSELFTVTVNRDERPPVVSTALTRCGDGRDPAGAADGALLPCGADGKHTDRL